MELLVHWSKEVLKPLYGSTNGGGVSQAIICPKAANHECSLSAWLYGVGLGGLYTEAASGSSTPDI